MVGVKSFAANGDTTGQAVAALEKVIDSNPIEARLVCIFYDADHHDEPIFRLIRDKFPDASHSGWNVLCRNPSARPG